MQFLSYTLGQPLVGYLEMDRALPREIAQNVSHICSAPISELMRGICL